MAGAEFPAAVVRTAFFDRENGRCFRCRRLLRWEQRGAVYDGGWSAHHRKPRGRGRSRDVALSVIENCLIVCGTGTTGCHGWVEKHRDRAIEQGLLIPGLATTDEYAPARVRVQRLSGSWWLLTPRGTAVEVEGPR
jgi:hypothetical protein